MNDQFYLQDSRTYVGNDVMWWAKDGNGYARMKLAGVELADSFTSQSVMPDFSKAR